MSAAAQLPYIDTRQWERSDLEILRDVSRIANLASDAEWLAPAIADRILAIVGVHRIILDAASNADWPGLDWGRAVLGPPAWVVARIVAGGRSWGTLRIYFSPSAIPLQSPVRFATFVGQQLAGAFARIHLRKQRDSHLRAIPVLSRRLQRRKVVDRTAGKIAELTGITQSEAVSYLIAQARSRRRPLLEVSIASLRFLEGRFPTKEHNLRQASQLSSDTLTFVLRNT